VCSTGGGFRDFPRLWAAKEGPLSRGGRASFEHDGGIVWIAKVGERLRGEKADLGETKRDGSMAGH
jgi:hypothetical protein